MDRVTVVFWVIWCLMTLAAAIGTAWVLRLARVPAAPVAHRGGRPASGRGTFICLGILALFLCAYAAMVLVGEDFVMYDNSQFTAFSMRGRNLPPAIWPEAGRFFPLGLQDHNLVGHFARTIAGLHALSLVQLLLLMAVLIAGAGRELTLGARVAMAMAAVSMPAVIVSFSSLIATERDIAVLIGCLFCFARRFEQTGLIRYAVAAVLSAQYMLYCKEIVFLMLLGFALARIGFRGWNSNSAANRLDLCIASVSVAFAAFYAYMMYPHTEASYLASVRLPLLEAARYYVRWDLVSWVFTAVTLVRLHGILRGRIAPSADWDALACAGLVYFAALVSLGMAGWYYSAPVDVIAVMYLGWLLVSSWPKLRLGVRVPAVAVAALLAWQSLTVGALRVLERKDFIHRKVGIARVIIEAFHREPGSPFDLYFPFTNAYVMSEYAAYLGYRGLPVEEFPVRPGRVVRFFGDRITKDGQCFIGRTFVCHAGAPQSARQVIVLPDDLNTGADPNRYDPLEKALAAVNPAIRPPGWLTRALVFLWGVT